MIKISRLNAFVFLVMFFVFVLTSKCLALFNLKITGIDYIMWFLFVALLFIINYKFLSRKLLIKQTYFWLFFILVIFCVLNYFVVDVPLKRYLQGTFFIFLFAVNFILFSNIKIERKDFFLIVDKIIFLLTAIAVLIYFERFFIEREYSGFFLRGVQTIVKDTGFAATFLNINIISCFSMFLIKRNKKYLYIAAFSFVTIALLLFLKAVVSSLIIFFLFIFIFFGRRVRRIIFFIFGGLLFLFFLILGNTFFKEVQYKQNLYFGSGSAETPRNALYIAGFRIAKDYFPFGSGQGTFGSYPVGKNYSPIYYRYGLHKLYGLGPDAVNSTKENFLFDTYWSHILGEMGFIASFFYLWLWIFPALKVHFFLWSNNMETKALSFIITLTIIVIFIESFALSIPEQLQFIMIYAGLGALAYKLLLQDTPRNTF